jgi:hypothetical protein
VSEKLYIVMIPVEDADVGSSRFYRCYLCEGNFESTDKIPGMISRKSDGDVNYDDYPRPLCMACATSTPAFIRKHLVRQAEDQKIEAALKQHKLDFLKGCLALSNDDPSPFSGFIAQVETEIEIAISNEEYYRAEAEIQTIEPLNTGPITEPASGRPGFVYLIGSPDGYCKIGRAKVLHSRLASIGLQLPYRVELLHSIEVSDCVWAERFLHKKFTLARQNGEWFLLTAEEINWIKSLTTLEPDEKVDRDRR